MVNIQLGQERVMVNKLQCKVTETELIIDGKSGEWYSLEHEMAPLDMKSWIAALRSDDFKQVDGELYGEKTLWDEEDNDSSYMGYCCLGVLGSICGIIDSDLGQNSLLVGDMAEITGMLEEECRSNYVPIGEEEHPHTLQDLLSRMNDDGWSFARIADWLEENLLIVDDDEIRV